MSRAQTTKAVPVTVLRRRSGERDTYTVDGPINNIRVTGPVECLFSGGPWDGKTQIRTNPPLCIPVPGDSSARYTRTRTGFSRKRRLIAFFSLDSSVQA